jgi:trehalose 6-phosphate phosphatase
MPLPRSDSSFPPPSEVPRPIAPADLAALLRGRNVLLCLDYDGTLAEIAREPAAAVPHGAVRAPLAALAAATGRVAVAIVSGRPPDEVAAMLALEHRPLIAGVHGLKWLYPDGRRRMSPDAQARGAELDAARRWLAANVPQGRGFLVEDKGVAIALHYRNVDDDALARDVAGRFAGFARAAAPGLRLIEGKKIVEVLPREAGKHRAVEMLCEEFGERYLPVYIGDDVTDEDAFAQIAAAGIGVLVGGARRSHARYRLASPDEVARFLDALAAVVASPSC